MLPKAYDPKAVEEKLAKLWKGKGVFKAEIDKNKKPFVIVIPPPNITGVLHMGHGLNNTLQDTLIRFNRMNGRSANWVPGTDHGGIATQNVIEKKLSKEQKLSRHDLGREKFVDVVWDWYKECGNAIYNQFEKMGWALDQSNIRFTMDEKRAQAVFETFKRLWDKKYIYRGKRMINWCVRCSTALSDIEVEHKEQNGKLWHLHYKMEDGSKGIVIATTRPETIFADAAIAVHPEDERYKNLIGKKVLIPLINRPIPIIADEAVEKDFGTGALKITPAHDPTDYEVGQRHNLEIIVVISDKGKMINVPEKYLGMDRELCRKESVKDLEEQGLLIKEEKYNNAVSTCYRCGNAIEPYLSEQWFVNMKELAAPAIKAIENEDIRFHPKNWKSPVLDWLKNIQDWCISRQIWWGHRIPVWYCRHCSKDGLTFTTDKQGKEQLTKVSFEAGAKPIISQEKPVCPICGSADCVQDPDVLDTWFSSALWPLSVFGWPNQTEDLKYYYPTSVLVTGYEIIYLWVARMIMMGLEFEGKVPFKDVILNGIVRDKTGQKMSKSKGNVIDPLAMTEKYGTDAVRFSLVVQANPGKDIPYSEDAITGARNFCNKIYNASRFILMNMGDLKETLEIPTNLTELADKWILARYNNAVKEAACAIEKYDMASAADTLYHFLWGDFCDWYIELAKDRFNGEDKKKVMALLVNILYGTLKALHPVMPFITEEIAISLKPYIKDTKEFLIQDSYPVYNPALEDSEALKEMALLQGIIGQIRTVRAQFNVPPSLKIKVILNTKAAEEKIINKYSSYIKTLAKVETLEVGQNAPKPKQSASAVFEETTIYIPLEGLIDFEKENARLNKELLNIQNALKNRERMLQNPSFLNNAPKEQVAKAREELKIMKEKEAFLQVAIKDLK